MTKLTISFFRTCTIEVQITQHTYNITHIFVNKQYTKNLNSVSTFKKETGILVMTSSANGTHQLCRIWNWGEIE